MRARGRQPPASAARRSEGRAPVSDEIMIHRANQIAAFFASYPEDEAIAGVTDHFKRFWEPRMREQIKAYVAAGGQGLHALVPPAVAKLD